MKICFFRVNNTLDAKVRQGFNKMVVGGKELGFAAPSTRHAGLDPGFS
jgi:hypothetical protein